MWPLALHITLHALRCLLTSVVSHDQSHGLLLDLSTGCAKRGIVKRGERKGHLPLQA